MWQLCVGMAKRAQGIWNKNRILGILWTSNAPSLFFVGHKLKSWMLLSVSWYFLWPIFSATENTMRPESSLLFEKTSKRSWFQFLPRPVLRDWGHGAISHYLSLSTLYSLYSLNTFISFWMNTVTKLLKVPTKQNVTNCWFYNWVIENSNYRIFLLNS